MSTLNASVNDYILPGGLLLYDTKGPSNTQDLKAMQTWAKANGYHEVTFTDFSNYHVFLTPQQDEIWKQVKVPANNKWQNFN